jgi:hypothetical protein
MSISLSNRIYISLLYIFGLGAAGVFPVFLNINSDIFLILFFLWIVCSIQSISYKAILLAISFLLLFSIKSVFDIFLISKISPSFLSTFLPDFRLLIISLLYFFYRDRLFYLDFKVIFFCVFLLHLTFNLIGEFNVGLYKNLQFFYHPDLLNVRWFDATGIKSTVAGHAAPWRLSGFYSLPSFAGLSALIYLIYFLLTFNSRSYFLNLILILLTLYLGFRSTSTIFFVGILILPFFILKRKYLLFSLSILLIIFIGSLFFLDLRFFIDNFMSGRFQDGSNVMLLLEQIDLHTFMFGKSMSFIPFYLSDNMFLIRVFSYGIFFTMFIYSIFYVYLYKLFGPYYFSISLFLFVIFLLAELGVRAVAAPTVCFIFLCFLLIKYKRFSQYE